MTSPETPRRPGPAHYRAVAVILTAALAIGLARAIPRNSFASESPGAIRSSPRDASTHTPRRIDPNTATLGELIALPACGPAIARRIIAARERGRFRRVEDLRRVRGIGPRTLERIRPFVHIPTEGPIVDGSTDPRSSADR